MSATTLARASKANAQEARVVSVAPPEKLLPGRAKLTAKLDQLKQAMGDLSDFTARAERAGVDETRAMEDEQLSETEALEKIQTAQLQKNIFKARIANREKAIATFSGELATAINEGTNELRGLVNVEVDRREKIIGDRVIAALEVGNAIDPTRMKKVLWDLVQFSGPVQLARALAPSLGIGLAQPGNAENLVRMAEDIMGKFERATAEAGKKI
jgi:hypothetical protein